MRRAPVVKKKKTTIVIEVPDGTLPPDENPLTDPAFLGQLAFAIKYIDRNSRPAANTPAQRDLMNEVSRLCLQRGISLRGQPLTDREKLILTGFAEKQ